MPDGRLRSSHALGVSALLMALTARGSSLLAQRASLTPVLPSPAAYVSVSGMVASLLAVPGDAVDVVSSSRRHAATRLRHSRDVPFLARRHVAGFRDVPQAVDPSGSRPGPDCHRLRQVVGD